MAENVVNSFLAIRDKDERLQALQTLVEQLSLEERIAVKITISMRNDIVTRLPFELTLSVFSYLNPASIWRLQLVSKAWRSRLSTKEFLRDALSRWNTHDPAHQAWESTAQGISTIDDGIRHIRAFREGRPFAWSESSIDGSIEEVQLCGQRLAYKHHTHGSGASVVVRDLSTGTTATLRSESRAYTAHVVLTTTTIAFSSPTEGCLYFKKLDDPRGALRNVRLPSANTIVASGDKDIIVLLERPANLDSTCLGTRTLLMFDASSQQLRTIDISIAETPDPAQRYRDTHHVLVNARKRFVDVFCAPPPEDQSVTLMPIHHCRVSFDGSIIRRSTELCDHGRALGFWGSRPPRNIGYEGLFMFQFISRSSGSSVLFDASLGAFVKSSPLLSAIPMRNMPCALWKGSIFHPFFPKLSKGHVRGTFGQDEEVYGQIERSSVERYNSYKDNLPALEPTFLVNDTFLVSVKALDAARSASRVHVYCFDERVPFHDGQSTGLWE